MRFIFGSDFHLEMHRDGGRALIKEFVGFEDACLIVAGDLAVGTKCLGRVLGELCARFAEVVYIAGNHDYYGTPPLIFQEELRKIDGRLSNLHYLERSCASIGGLVVAGTTLWFKDRPDNAALSVNLSDFSEVPGFSNWVYEENRKCLEFLVGLERADLVITHHLPTIESVSAPYRDSPLNRFFLCEVGGEIRRIAPCIWCHGHTHDSVDLHIGSTRVLCNPFGYPMSPNPLYTLKSEEVPQRDRLGG